MTGKSSRRLSTWCWLGFCTIFSVFSVVITYNLYTLRKQLFAVGTNYSPGAILQIWQKELYFQVTLFLVIALVGLFAFWKLKYHQTESDQKLQRSEEMVLLRYQLLDYATNHTVDELLQYALNEVCRISNSQAGFYYFVDTDEQAVILKAWSVCTQQGCCAAYNHPEPYSPDLDNVLADAMISRAPLIHNDCTTLAHKKQFCNEHITIIRELVVPVIRNERIVAVLGVGNKSENYIDKDAEDILYLADVAWEIIDTRRAYSELKQANELLAKQARVDFLTGIYNRRMFDQMLEAELARLARHDSMLSLIMFDIDHFKKVNDNLGHAGGDLVLQKIAELVSGRIRSHDIFCRWGGEEFIILLPANSLFQAAALAEILCTLISQYDFKNGMQITSSFGVAEYQHKETPHSFVKRADTALYRAKQQGRNQVVIY